MLSEAAGLGRVEGVWGTGRFPQRQAETYERPRARSAGTKSLQWGHLKPLWRSVWPAISSAVKVFLQCGQTISCGTASGISFTRPRYLGWVGLGEEGAVRVERRTLRYGRLAAR